MTIRYFVWQFYPSNGLMLGPRHLHRAQWSFLPCLATWLTSDSSANPTMSSSASSSKLRTAEDDAGFCLCWGCWRCWAGWTIPQRLPTWLAPEEDLQVFLFLEAWRPGAVMHHRSPRRFMKCLNQSLVILAFEKVKNHNIILKDKLHQTYGLLGQLGLRLH